jgi:hypothetical protein
VHCGLAVEILTRTVISDHAQYHWLMPMRILIDHNNMIGIAIIMGYLLPFIYPRNTNANMDLGEAVSLGDNIILHARMIHTFTASLDRTNMHVDMSRPKPWAPGGHARAKNEKRAPSRALIFPHCLALHKL